MRPKSYLILLLLPLLVACQSPPPPEADEADKAAADAKLQQMLATKQRQAAFADKQRQLEEDRQAKREVEAARPHYSQYQLEVAAKPRHWADITVPDLNVHAVFNSNWQNDKLNYRIALLGEKHAIDTFLNQHESYGVNFADQSGNQIFAFGITPQQFEWAPPGFNGGIPTMQTTGSIECDLPIYEHSVQWNLTWQN
jgi:hypothetical protein